MPQCGAAGPAQIHHVGGDRNGCIAAGVVIGTGSKRQEVAVRSLALEERKHRRTVLFGIGLQLRRIYDVAEREPVPDHITRLLDKLDDEGAMAEAGSTARNRSQ
jgi:hypothetical protein